MNSNQASSSEAWDHTPPSDIALTRTCHPDQREGSPHTRFHGNAEPFLTVQLELGALEAPWLRVKEHPHKGSALPPPDYKTHSDIFRVLNNCLNCHRGHSQLYLDKLHFADMIVNDDNRLQNLAPTMTSRLPGPPSNSRPRSD